MTMPNKIFPAKFAVLDDVREFVSEIARQNNFNDKDIYNLQLAADEAASNIIEHAYVGVADGTLEVVCEMQGDSIVITMRDKGKPFDPSSVTQPNLKADLYDRQVGGLGVYLMKKIMDDLSYESDPQTGNLLTMSKRRG